MSCSVALPLQKRAQVTQSSSLRDPPNLWALCTAAGVKHGSWNVHWENFEQEFGEITKVSPFASFVPLDLGRVDSQRPDLACFQSGIRTRQRLSYILQNNLGSDKPMP